MIREKSCGAVIYTVKDGQVLYLLEKMKKGHISLCKGHVEGAETERETASREILEETALTVRFLDGFRETIEYSPYPGCRKEVVFFLAKADHTRTVPQESEVREILWAAEEDAIRMLTHDSDKNTLRRAAAQLKKEPQI